MLWNVPDCAEPCEKSEVLLQWRGQKIPWAKLDFGPSFPISQQPHLFFKNLDYLEIPCNRRHYYLKCRGETGHHLIRESPGECVYLVCLKKTSQGDSVMAFKSSSGNQHSAAVGDGTGRKEPTNLQQLPLEVSGRAPCSSNKFLEQVWSSAAKREPYLLCGLD